MSAADDITRRDVGAAVPGRWPPRLKRLAEVLACPRCRGELRLKEDAVVCWRCDGTYPVRNEKIYFAQPAASEEALDTTKKSLKQFLGRYYYSVGVRIVAPTYPFDFRRTVLKHTDPRSEIVLDIGCGANRIDDEVIAVDVMDYPPVDIVVDIASLPFRDGALGAVVSRSALEHIPNLASAISEIIRCTRAGGLSIHLIPFLFPYHASPHDYQRLTHRGAGGLFPGWTVTRQYNATGPVTLFLVCLIEFLAIVLSIGNARLKAMWYLALCLLLFPLKFFDAPFIRRPAFLSIAPTILTIVQKP